MIFLSRMKDEGIVIGDDIVITVTEIEGDDVRLDIDHPPEVSVEKRQISEPIEQMMETSPQP